MPRWFTLRQPRCFVLRTAHKGRNSDGYLQVVEIFPLFYGAEYLRNILKKQLNHFLSRVTIPLPWSCCGTDDFAITGYEIRGRRATYAILLGRFVPCIVSDGEAYIVFLHKSLEHFGIVSID